MDNTVRIHDLPENERPRERLLRYGAETLTNSELIAIILRTGAVSENILYLSSRLIKECGGLNGLSNYSFEEFRKIKGIGTAKASQLVALLEICKRLKSYRSGDEYRISQPEEAAKLIMEEMRYLKQEHLKVIMLNTKNAVLFIKDVSIGSLNSSIVHPREVFCDALKKSSASIIVCHNHPSGDPTPSSEDLNITKRLKECGKILGIELLDHIIIGNGSYISLKEKGFI